ncbi:hypothetical protein NC652_035903 [Populus alba x Populus x berolinensis]|uniref:TRIP4/RQT4 C2HC5-type zinc finger domain-containing protein n=1 Tax=Populus alba x Populus x berolinensis TaxID=444605 RepID=A0AAD6PU53_9ROSI|nr:hypothetical protein NC652_035903 [Populus alba x Populus x berolinensis]KAJ6967686.1 hypothetical protein NC653_035799 [Populus alba x Populus x berolinensis]
MKHLFFASSSSPKTLLASSVITFTLASHFPTSKREKSFHLQRKPCPCQARQHRLVSNCLSCGKIVCEQEGEGPCRFCSALVLKERSMYAVLEESMGTINSSTTVDVREPRISIANVLPLFSSQTTSKG